MNGESHQSVPQVSEVQVMVFIRESSQMVPTLSASAGRLDQLKWCAE